MRKFLVLFFILIIGSVIFAEEEISIKEIYEKNRLKKRLESDYDFYAQFPILEFPYNSSGNPITRPSMASTLGYVDGSTQGIHYWIGHFDIDLRFTQLAIITADLGFYLTGNVWAHEQGHYTILQYNGIDSQIKIGGASGIGGSTTPSEAGELQLNELKKNNISELVRVDISGIEMETQWLRTMSSRSFNYYTKSMDSFMMVLTALGSVAYLASDSNTLADLKKNPTQNRKDVLYGDTMMWVYDLFNPNDSYLRFNEKNEAVYGIDEWIPTEEEIKYQDVASERSFFNFLDPQIFGVKRISAGDSLYFNFATRFWLTPFGQQFMLDTYFIPKNNYNRYQLTFTRNTNYREAGYGLMFKQTALKVPYGDITYEIHGWQQPKDLKFYASEMDFGGMVALDYNINIKENFDVTIGGGYKSRGWVPGVIDMKPSGFFRAGIVTKF
ncbi:MAG: hypothetical protein ACRCSK_00410 [Fusobacteriaceae bacterium]